MKYQKKNREQLEREVKQLRLKIDELQSCKNGHAGLEYPLEKAGWQMEKILNTLVEHVVYHDTDMKVLWANRAACQSAGLDLKRVIGRHCYEIWAQRSLPCDDCPVNQALKYRKPHSVEKKTPDGRYWYINASPVFDANGRIVSMVELTLDISERKKVEDALRQAKDELDRLVQERTAKLAESEAKYRALVENTKDIPFSINVHGILEYIGPQSIQYGFDPKLLEGRHISDIAFPDDKDIVVSEFNNSIDSGETSPAELRILTPDGRLIWLEQCSSLQRDGSGKIIGITGVLRDISARKKAERQRRKYRKRLQSLTVRLAMSQDEEQRRIAEGLHDDVGQDLALCNLKLALADREKDLLKANAIRNEVSELIHNTAEKVRSLCFELSSSTLYRIGFKEALVELCNSMSKRYGVHFKVDGNYHGQKLDDTMATVLFKATRELLFNVVKHSGIEEATVFITGKGNMLNLTVEDRGSGFSHFDDGNLIDVGAGVGLFGIKERLRDLGGELHIESIPGDKTRVMLMVPTGMFAKQC